MEQLCTCIIPFHNEWKRVVHVLKTLAQIPYFHSIILVNDGSTDHAESLLEAYIAHSWKKHITIISYPQNRWKSHAVKQWSSLVQTPYVFLCDADFIDLDSSEVTYMITQMSMHPEIDMGILRFKAAGWYNKLIGWDIGWSWQRMLRTTDLQQICTGNFTKYQLEAAINSYMRQNNKIVVWFPFSAHHVRKNKKQWFFTWMKKELLMFYDILTYQKIDLLAKNTLFFKPPSIHTYLSKN